MVSDPVGSAVDRDSHPAPERIVLRVLRSSWFWPMIVMGGMGLWRIRLPEMWQDELVTIDVTARSTRQILALLRHVDAVHGTYYLLMHGWVRVFGDSPLAMRAPSVMAMAGAAACVALLGQRLFGRSAGIAGGLVFAMIPAVTRFAQEARSYACVVLFVALATLVLLVALERSSVWAWAGYAACVTAIGCLNAVALSVVAGHLVAVLLHDRRGRTGRTLLTFGLAVACGAVPTLPVLYLGNHQAVQQIHWINGQSHSVLVVWPRTFASAWVAWAVTALVVLAVIGHRRRTVFPVAAALVPVLVVWLASLGNLNYFFSKYLLFVVPLWAVLAGAGLTAWRWRTGLLRVAVPAAGVGVLAVLAVPGQIAMRGALSHSYLTYPDPRDSVPLAYREAATIIARNYQPGDAIGYPQLPGVWWFMHDKGINYYLPKNVKLHTVFLDKSAAENNELYGTECAVPARCFGNERRIWVVLPYKRQLAFGDFADPERALLATNYEQVYVTYPSGMTVALIQHK
ncbi:glycosyltransferase family 39 protein [Planosporangium sp. 12N6]|uniref:glycosyltransferase family 39 protein n=1 Tax=Planosporangium spinosum TaxID=3402278 RepID=UPI003CE85EE3